MQIKGILINKRQYIFKKTFAMLFFYLIGVICGSVYCSFLPQHQDSSLISYLSDFFVRIEDGLIYSQILKSSLLKNFGIFLVIFILSFFRFGGIGIILSVMSKGFSAGFASGLFAKYYGAKGILICLSSSCSSFLFIPVLLFFSASSAMMSSDRRNADKFEKRKYLLLSICCLTIFCVCSVLDSFLTTTFMKLIASKLLK